MAKKGKPTIAATAADTRYLSSSPAATWNGTYSGFPPKNWFASTSYRHSKTRCPLAHPTQREPTVTMREQKKTNRLQPQPPHTQEQANPEGGLRHQRARIFASCAAARGSPFYTGRSQLDADFLSFANIIGEQLGTLRKRDRDTETNEDLCAPASPIQHTTCNMHANIPIPQHFPHTTIHQY